MRLLLISGWLMIATSAAGQATVFGKWNTIDDHTGKIRSVVEIIEREGAVFGQIVKIFPQPNEKPDPVCDKCSLEDPRHNQKIIGMEIIQRLRKQGDAYSGGDILDPDDGKVYRAKVWLEGKVLKVRGYWGPFFRTQTWQRAD